MAGILPLPLRRLHRSVASRLARVSSLGLSLLPCATPLVSVPYSGVPGSDRVVVFLPGIGDVAEDFAARGFIRMIAERDLPGDAIAVDAHYGYYARRSVVDRLARDVVLPARQRGYREVWLVGISLGGTGALSYVMQHPGHVQRVVLLAPYLGEPRFAHAFSVAGASEPGSMNEHLGRVWRWIGSGALGKDVYLGYGTDDRFARMNALLSEKLPPENVVTTNGGHDWATWTTLWKTFLASWQRQG